MQENIGGKEKLIFFKNIIPYATNIVDTITNMISTIIIILPLFPVMLGVSLFPSKTLVSSPESALTNWPHCKFVSFPHQSLKPPLPTSSPLSWSSEESRSAEPGALITAER